MKSGHASTPNLFETTETLRARPQSPEPPPASRYTLTLASPPTMHHSSSMPNFGSVSPTSPQSRTRPQSPLDEFQPSPSSNRHSLFISPVASPTLQSKHPHSTEAQKSYNLLLLESIEDAIQSCLSDDYSLLKFDFIDPSHSDPSGQFHCIIAKTNGTVVMNELYSIMKLRSIENLVDSINSHNICDLSAAQIYRGLDPNNILLSPLSPGPGNAVFVTGECLLLGNWQSAIRLNYSEHHKAWRFTLPPAITHKDYKFKLGLFSAGKNPESNTLIWEEYNGNRQLLSVQCQQKSTGLRK